MGKLTLVFGILALITGILILLHGIFAMVVLQYFSPEDQAIVFGIVLIPIGIFLIRQYVKDKKKAKNS